MPVRMHPLPALLLMLALLFALPARAQDALPEDGPGLAKVFLERMNAATMLDSQLQAQRQGMIGMLTNPGRTPDQAGQLVDQFLMPEMHARSPELVARFEEILVALFTPGELKAILTSAQDEDRRTAAAKAPQLASQFAEAGRDWGSRVGAEAYTKHLDEIRRLGLDSGGSGK